LSLPVLSFSIKDYGYTVISRLETLLRRELSNAVMTSFGESWVDEIPQGIQSKFIERSHNESIENSNVGEVLDETDFPDILDLLSYKKNYKKYFPNLEISELKKLLDRIYPLRCQIAHVKSSFAQMDFELLMELSEETCKVLEIKDDDFDDLLNNITKSNQNLVIKTPFSFVSNFSSNEFCLNNLPDSDYAPDGGFIGRAKDQKRLMKLIKNGLDRIVTIIGAGGVGKSALAHKICDYFVYYERSFFDSVIWVSSKEEYLTASGIEKVEPSFYNYESLLDTIIEIYGLSLKGSSIDEKESTVDLIFQANEKGILLVIDNLETIKDESVLEYIKDIPLPNKVLITSRLGLGEIERRMPLSELDESDAVKLFRTISIEKGIDSIAKLPEDILKTYVSKMFRYPLAIKWTIGQVAIGVDLNFAINKLSTATGDLVKFCFEYIFEESLNDNDKIVLFSLSLYENAVGRGIISHVSSLDGDSLDEAVRKLVVASLIIPTHEKNDDRHIIETKYDLLPLTRNFVQSELRKDNVQLRDLSVRKNATENLVNEGERAGNEYVYSLSSYGASTEEEKIAVTLIINAHRYNSQNKDYERASKEYFKASEIAPDFAIVYRNWASFEAEYELYDKADELMKKATNISPEDSRLWFTWGNIEKKRQQYDSALKYFQKALTYSPTDGAIYGMLGEIEKRLGHFDSAEKHLLKAIEIGQSQREEVRNEVVNKTVLADLYRRWSDVTKDSDRALTGKKLNQALNVANEAFTLNNNDQTAEYRLKETYLYNAMFHHSEKNKPLALEFFKSSLSEGTAISKFKRLNVKAYYFLAWIAYQENEKKVSLLYVNEGKKYFCGHPVERKYSSIESLLNGNKEDGFIDSIVSSKAFGFIKPNDSKVSKLFFHLNDVEGDMDLSSFERLTGKRVSYLRTEILKKGKLELVASFVEILSLSDNHVQGVLRNVVTGKGFGFTHADNKELFVHFQRFSPQISKTYFESLEGREISFIIEENPTAKGKFLACNIQML
jgi:LuxR family glucitol operon transcriptional activator